MGVTFEIDHVTPRGAGGATALANLCLCCPTCNRHKASRTLSADPASGKMVPLFHPIREAWSAHFEWCDGATIIAGWTPTGRATVEALRINRPVMIELRRYWAATGRHPPPTIVG
jgi:HNH endonuclease